VEFVAAQVKVAASELGFYEWNGPTIKRHRGEIRRFFGFRKIMVTDEEKLTDWLAGDYAQRVRRAELVRDVTAKVVAEWVHLALIESPSHMRRHADIPTCADHSLVLDPTVVRLRTAAAAVGKDIWIAVRLPGEYEGDDDLDDEAAITRWTSVVATSRSPPQGPASGMVVRRRPPCGGNGVVLSSVRCGWP
jgi:Domain of unknown function (DUF4158)